MLSRVLKRYSFLLLCFFVVLLTVRTAEACSCGPLPTVLDAFNSSDVVVVATVVSVEKAGPEQTAAPGYMSNGRNYVDGVKSTSTRVEQVFKGAVKVGDEMIFAQGGGGDCIWTFKDPDVGQKYLFYLHRFQGATRWIASTCGRSNPVDQVQDDLLYLNNLNKVRNKTRISGTIRFYYEGSDSVADRKIRIVGPNRTWELKTDDKGVYEIYDLPAGRYYVEPEVPKGWKVARFWLDYSPSLDRKVKDGPLQKIPIILEAKKHAGLDIVFEIDNAVRGHVYDPLGQPMKDVCLQMLPADGSKGAYLGDCTEADGSFELHQIPPGAYIIVVNKDGEITSRQPFGTFYHPKAAKPEDATVFNIAVGDIVENVEIRPTIEAETVTVEGVLLFSDGKPVADEWVFFKSLRKQGEGDEVKQDRHDAGTKTDLTGWFSIKLLKGVTGYVYGSMHSYVGEYENCPELDRLIKLSVTRVPELTTLPVELTTAANRDGIELRFSFPSCKKAP